MLGQVASLFLLALSVVLTVRLLSQARRPEGWLGRFYIWSMNRSHAGLIAWGMDPVEVGPSARILDIGCGGGRTIARLVERAAQGRVVGLDYAEASLREARRANAARIATGQVDVVGGSVSQLPFPDGAFDLACAVETHYYWPEPASDFREVLRVLKPGGHLLLLAEVYKEGRGNPLLSLVMKVIGARYLSEEEHRALLAGAGFEEIQVEVEPKRGWLRARARRPA